LADLVSVFKVDDHPMNGLPRTSQPRLGHSR